MTLSRISIERPVLTTMMSLALVLFGLISLTRLPVRELPNIDPPIVSVLTVYPGANAQVVETEVTEQLEEAINSIEGIKTLTSSSREQVSSIAVEFDLSRDIDLAAQDVRDRVARIRGRLPEDILEPVTSKQESDAQPILWVSLNSDRHSPLDLTTLAERQIKNRLQTVGGVSSVIIGGEKRFAMRLWLDSEQMAARGVTVLDVERALREQNVELPSGRVENLDREMSIQTRGELKTVEEYNHLVIRSDGTKLVRLHDVGRAEEGVEDLRTVARFNGRPSVFLGVVKQSRANTVQVAHEVKAELERLAPTLPQGIALIAAYDSSIFVEEAINEVWLTLGIAFVLVVLVIFVFLRNLRSTLVPVVVIPVSIVGTLTVLYAMGYSVNILTMLALVLAIGIVVDDAIVVLENIYRHIEAGEPPLRAAFRGMEEIGFAILAITVSLVAVFVPLAFQQTAAGRLFIEFAFALAGSVVISAFVALSLSPMMAARLLRPVNKLTHGPVFLAFDRGFNALNALYGRLLEWSLRHRLVVLGAGLATFALLVLAYRTLDQEFLPEEDRGDLIQLSSVVDYRTGSAPNAIEHYDRLRSATLTATPVGITLGTAIQRVEDTLADSLPAGFLHAWSGESRDFLETQHQFWWILGLAVVIVYMVLASQFESLVQPLTVMLALPLAGVGAFGLLALLNLGGQRGLYPPIPAMTFNLFSQIGLVLLVGLVTKNSILLVEFANQKRRQGAPPATAMLQAGLIRLRPILMTSFSTIAGILPIAIGFGAGSESRRPMGVAVVGGLFTSTFLTLFVIPVVYTTFSSLAAALSRKPVAASPALAAGK